MVLGHDLGSSQQPIGLGECLEVDFLDIEDVFIMCLVDEPDVGNDGALGEVLHILVLTADRLQGGLDAHVALGVLADLVQLDSFFLQLLNERSFLLADQDQRLAF